MTGNKPSRRERSRKLKDDFLRRGLLEGHDERALETLLLFGSVRQDVRALARTLLRRFGSLSGVLDTDAAVLACVPGMSGHTAALLKLIPQITRKALTGEVCAGTPVKTADTALAMLENYFFGCTDEVVYALFLDGARKVCCCRKVSRGTERFANIDARRLAEIALGENAESLYLAHNHPRGRPEPSREDRAVTQALKTGLDSVGLTLLGHFIFADGESSLFSGNCGASGPQRGHGGVLYARTEYGTGDGASVRLVGRDPVSDGAAGYRTDARIRQ